MPLTEFQSVLAKLLATNKTVSNSLSDERTLDRRPTQPLETPAP